MNLQVAKWRCTHSTIPLLEIAALSLLTSGTQLLLPFLGTCQPCVLESTHHVQRIRSMHPSISLINTMGPFGPQDMFGPKGLLGSVTWWGGSADSKFDMAAPRDMHDIKFDDASMSVTFQDPLYATVVADDSVLQQNTLEAPTDAFPETSALVSFGEAVGGEKPQTTGSFHLHRSATVNDRTCAPYLQRTRSLLMYSKCPASTYNDVGVLVFSDPNQVCMNADPVNFNVGCGVELALVHLICGAALRAHRFC